MRRKTKAVDSNKQYYRIYKGYDSFPVVFLGVLCDFEKYFLEWIMKETEELEVNIDDGDDLQKILNKIINMKSHKLNINLYPLTFYSGVEGICLKTNECVIGLPLHAFPESMSLKRMKIELFNNLVKIKILKESADLEMIDVYNDVLVYKKGEE